MEFDLTEAELQGLLGRQIANRPWPAPGTVVTMASDWDGPSTHHSKEFLSLKAGDQVKITEVSPGGAFLRGTVVRGGGSGGRSGWLGGAGCEAKMALTIAVPLGNESYEELPTGGGGDDVNGEPEDVEELLLSLVILANFIIIILEANYGAACDGELITSGCIPAWPAIANYFFVAFYTLETLATLFVYRSRVCRDGWMLFDLGIVFMAWVDICVAAVVTTAGLQEVQLLRLFRIARLARAARIVHMSPELHAMMIGIISALTTVFWGLIMVMLLLAIWAVLAVELLHGTAQEVHVDNQKCLEAFDSVFMVMLMFFQTLMAGDSWGDCAIPMIQKNPLSLIIFGGSLLTVQLGFANLVLAVIVERSRQAHEEEQRQNIFEQFKKRREAENRLREMCQAIDVDRDGVLTLDELMDAYATNEEFRKTLFLLEIDETDLICLFDLMDVDRSGDLTYEELISCINKSETNDLKRQMMLVKLQVQDIWLRVRDHLNDAQENIINSVKGETRKPSLLDAKTYLIRKLTRDSSASSHTSLPAKKSNMSAFCKDFKAMMPISEQQDAGTEYTAPVFAVRQLHTGLKEELKQQLESQLESFTTFIDREISELIFRQWPLARELDANNWQNAQDQWGVEVEDVNGDGVNGEAHGSEFLSRFSRSISRELLKRPKTIVGLSYSFSLGGGGTGGIGSFASPREAWRSTEEPLAASPRCQPRDALSMALERAQDHIEALQRERDDALRRAAEHEAEVLRLTMLVERSEAGHCALLEERQRELAEVQRLRKEHREARDQLQVLKAEVNQTRAHSDDKRQRFERLITEQREQIEVLQEANGHAERQLQDRGSQSMDIETSLFSCLQERTALLQFMVDLLSALQTLFYDPTPFTRLSIRSPSPSPASGSCRRRPPSREAWHRHAGCFACGSTDFAPPMDKGLKEAQVACSEDLKELCNALEGEIAQASQAFSAQVQRVLAEAEQSARAVSAAQPGQLLRACAAWVEQEKRRKERQGLPVDRPVPAVDWGEERAQYLATTRAMESKFAQLLKLRRLHQVRHSAARKKAPAGRY
ncbi:unnamed protein product [Effrenium voratum]|nr:unnamed protein product [Effrenium voratum]